MAQRELVELASNGDREAFSALAAGLGERETPRLITIAVTPILPFYVGVC